MEQLHSIKIEKNLNLCHHKSDFGIDAEWHFFATSHRKEPCDGLGGTVKQLAARASLQRPYDHQIMKPCQLYEWASASTIVSTYCTTDDYKKAETFLEHRFQQSRTIPGTQKHHCFIPFRKDKLYTKLFSNSNTQKEEKTAICERDELSLEEIKGFVTAVYNDQWWIGCVLHKDQDSREIKINFLCPQGPSHSFKYPAIQNILVIPHKDVLTKVDPRTVTGSTYTITNQESKTATDKLKAWKTS